MGGVPYNANPVPNVSGGFIADLALMVQEGDI